MQSLAAAVGEAQDRAGQDRPWVRAAGEAYARYIEQVRGSFPRGLQRIFNRYYLHDALVHRVAQSGTSFLIQLRLGTPPHPLLTFHYRLLRRRAEARWRAERREVRSLREHWEAVPYDRMGRDPGRLSVEEAGQLVAEPTQHLGPGDIDGVDG